MKQYWVSLIIQNDDDRRAWLSAMSDSVSTIEQAKVTIKRARSNFKVLSAWIDEFDENDKKTTVYHRCYVDSLGM